MSKAIAENVERVWGKCWFMIVPEVRLAAVKSAVLEHLQAQDEDTVAKWSGETVLAKLAKWEAETLERLAARAMSVNYRGE